MLSRLMKNKKLAELMAANKVDDSVISVIKENEKAYDNTKRKIRKLNSDIEEINGKIESVKHHRSEVKIFNLKEHKKIYNEIAGLKNEIKSKQSEIDALDNLCIEHENIGSVLKDEIEKQHFVFIENEIYVKAIERIESRGIDLPGAFYKRYLKYVSTYKNSEFSLKYGTKIVEPDVRDLVFIAGVLKKNEELHGTNDTSKEIAQETKKDVKITKTAKKTTSPKKVVEELTSNKVVKMKKKNEESASSKAANNGARKKEVVNQ